jgi:hypothetical protein
MENLKDCDALIDVDLQRPRIMDVAGNAYGKEDYVHRHVRSSE